MRIASCCQWIITICFGLLFGLVPFLLTPWNYELFEYNKMMAAYGLTTIIVGSWAVKMIAQKEIRIVRTPLDIPLALFLSSQLVSSLFSMDPHVSWFGYYSRFNGGMLSIISYILLFYAFVSNKQFNNVTLFLKLALASATVVALYGVAERLGIDKHLWVQDVQNRVFSTLGQPNWLAAYIVALVPIASGLGLQVQSSKFKVQNIFWLFVSVLFFLVLLFTRSRSGLAGFALADAAFWFLVFIRGPLAQQGVPLKRLFWRPVIILHFAFLIIVFLNGTHIAAIDRWFTFEAWRNRLQQPTTYNLQPTTSPADSGTLLEYGGTESVKIRNYVWQGAVNAWKSTPKTMLIGTGTETFAFAFFRYKPVGHNLTSEWDFLYNKAHNEYLNYLATTGILGLGSYLLLIGAFVWWFAKVQSAKCKVQNKFENNFEFCIINFALFAGWASILVTNLYGFSVVITNVFLFLFPAMIFVISQQFNNVTIKQLRWPRWIVSLPIIVGLVLLVKLVSLWYADTQFAAGYRSGRAGEFTNAYPLLKTAVSLNAGEPFYHDEYASALAGLASTLVEKQEGTGAAALVGQSIKENDIALAKSPKNVNFWKTRTKIFYAFSDFDKEFNKTAIKALEKAAELSPADPKIFYNLAILYGREADNTKSIELLEKTIALKANYRDAYYALYIFYNETKNPEKARDVLKSYLDKVDPGDKDFQGRVKQ